MNKIVLEQDEYTFQDEEKELNIANNNIFLNIKGQVYLKITAILKNTILNINLNKASSLLLELDFALNNNYNTLNIVSDNASNLNLNFASLIQGENEIIINNEINSNDCNVKIHFRGVSEYGKIVIKATGKIHKNTTNNKYLEDIKVITSNSEFIKIMPDLLVDSNSVEASHNANISNLDENQIFYLMSKGIPKLKAQELLKEGFLKSILHK